jgi:hypothetical protein
MTSAVKPPTEHVAPPASPLIDSDRWRTLRVLMGLFGAPLAWVAQMSVCVPLAANACYAYHAPLATPSWKFLPLMLTVISMTCGIIGLLAAFSAWSMWQRTRTQLPAIKDDGRARFLAILAAMSSFVFVIAIIFTSCAILLVSPCHPWS